MSRAVIAETEVRSTGDMLDDDFASQSEPRWTAVPVLRQLASLKLTVVLLSMAIALVFFGTLAQARLPIQVVVSDFFRSFFVWINVKHLLPPSFFGRLENLGNFYFPYPGGLTIGSAMLVNLLAAHSVRFKVQASGNRLIAGLCVIALGLVVTTIVILTGMGSQGAQEFTLSWDSVWTLLLVCMVGLCGAMVYGALSLKPNETTMRWGLFVAAAGLGGLLLWLVASFREAPLSDPAMRILWQLIKGTSAGLVLLVGCQLAFKRRAGVVLIHVGVGMMMVNELLVGFYAQESHMRIAKGETVNFAFDSSQVELAIVDTSHRDEDVETVVPREMLIVGEKISDDLLPFDIELVEFQENSIFESITGRNNQATAGKGLDIRAVATHRITGTDRGQDLPSAYVRLTDRSDGSDLGTFLVATGYPYLADTSFHSPDVIDVDGTRYDFYLRFRRTYKPYSIHLLDAREEDYIGTSVARDYSSDIHLFNNETGDDIKDIHVWMNNPYRYLNEAFYQSELNVDPNTHKVTTVLQIVGNDNWMIPYIGCMIVAVGLLAHFSLSLRRFLSHSNALQKTSGASLVQGMASIRFLLPASIVFLLGVWVANRAISAGPTVGGIDIDNFGRIPVMHEGRVKPFDTFARDLMRQISKRSTFRMEGEEIAEGSNEETGQTREKKTGTFSATLWLLDMIANAEVGETHRVVRIETLEIINELGLEKRPGKWRYSLKELSSDNRNKIRNHAEAASNKERLDRTHTDNKWMELHRRLFKIDVILASTNAPTIRWEDPEHFGSDFQRAYLHGQHIDANNPPLLIPIDRPGGEAGKEAWETLYSAFLKAFTQQRVLGESEINPTTRLWTEIIVAYQQGNAEEFNRRVNQYHAFLDKNTPDGTDLAKVQFESYFNRFNPFALAEVFYIFVFVLTAISWLTASLLRRRPDEKNVWRIIFGSRAFYASAAALILATFVLHTFALGARMYISGRPPVTTLYSSAVFIGWGIILIAMVMEAFYRRGIGIAVAAWMGFGTLWIADYLALGGDTLPVLVAVLDSQFWLATHVTCITFGYAVTYLAGMLGIAYVLGGVFTRSMNTELRKELAKMIYGSICFSIYFSFVGTVLGGLWGDDSWGRFWGWDTKENGALIIVLWNALVLHARWGGMVRERGMAVLAVAGNIAVTWSWFGVNELGVGLHNYGFTEGTLLRLSIACLIFITIIAIGCLPTKYWKGFTPPSSNL